MLNKIKANGHIVLMVMAPVALAGFLFGQSSESTKSSSSNTSSVVISDIITQPRLGWAVVYWTTDTQTTGRVDYGTTESYGYISGETGGSASVKHKAYLTGIGEGTYHFRVTATDPKTGKQVTSSDQTVKTYPIVDAGYPAVVGCKNELRVPEDYQHIQAALDATCRGGTVYVGPGEYRENVATWGGVSLIGAGASKTTIRGPGVGWDTWGETVHLVAAAVYSDRDGRLEYVNPTLSGFTITSDYVQETKIVDNVYAYDGSVGVTVSSGPSSKWPIIKNNIFKHLDMGVLLIQYDQPAAVINNTFVGGKGQDYAVLMAFGGGTPYPNWPSNLIENNAIVNYQKAGVLILCPAGGCDSLRSGDFTIQYNNTWRNTKDYLFTENLTWRVYETVNSPMWSYYLSKIQIPVAKTQHDPAGKNGNISADPLFMNANTGDYHERVGSPHVDAGNPKSDFSLEPQPNGGRVNMGAYGNTSEAALSR